MPAARKPPPPRPAPKPPSPPPRPAPRPAPPPPKPAPRPAPKPAPKSAAKPAARAPAKPAAKPKAAARPKAPARPVKAAATRKSATKAPAGKGKPGARQTAAKPAGRTKPKQAKGKPKPKVTKGKAAKKTKTPVAKAAGVTRWYKVLASVYDANGQGGSCGNTSDGKFHFAELGVAGDYGHGAAHGEGNLARAFGRGGQLGCGFGLYVRYKGRTTYATKSDVGYGNTSVAPNADNQRSIDLLRNLADWLHFDGVDTVEVAFKGDGQAPAPSTVDQKAAYANPLEHANVTPERIDQGVDYAGTGWLGAIAEGEVTTVRTNDAGWEGGSFIEYRITQRGQLNGAYVYYAEGVEPNVSKGDKLAAGDKVATLIPGFHSGIEIGFGAGNGGQSYYAYHDGRYDEKSATRPGIAFSNLIASLHGPPGKIEGPEAGKWPEYVPDGDITGVTNTLPASSDPGGIDLTPQDAGNEANSVDWGGSVKRKWHDLQAGAYGMNHHSNSARAFALGKTYITTGG